MKLGKSAKEEKSTERIKNFSCNLTQSVVISDMAFLEKYIWIRKRCTRAMKEGIHPYYQQTTITCACGNVIETGSTKQNIKVEVCSKCHPFFTGKQKLVDTGGRVAKFNKKFGLNK